MKAPSMLLTITCRSELAREKPESAAFIRFSRVIVNDLREQARSYSEGRL